MSESFPKSVERVRACTAEYVLAINEAIQVMSGKWKLPILTNLMFGKKRFSVLNREISGITPRMLSKELKDLEMNGMVKRIAHDSNPPIVEYELTSSGYSISEVLDRMMEWGVAHRRAIMQKPFDE